MIKKWYSGFLVGVFDRFNFQVDWTCPCSIKVLVASCNFISWAVSSRDADKKPEFHFCTISNTSNANFYRTLKKIIFLLFLSFCVSVIKKLKCLLFSTMRLIGWWGRLIKAQGRKWKGCSAFTVRKCNVVCMVVGYWSTAASHIPRSREECKIVSSRLAMLEL